MSLFASLLSVKKRSLAPWGDTYLSDNSGRAIAWPAYTLSYGLCDDVINSILALILTLETVFLNIFLRFIFYSSPTYVNKTKLNEISCFLINKNE